ncbi:MAG: EVE domain-containing protein [SAR202 cluster bacterium]|nr:EVE domain-containing protein [SAR202 cluster bacterium]
MPKNYWMVVQTPEQFSVTKSLGFSVYGMTAKQRKRARRMEPEDRVLIYVTGMRKWPAIAIVTSKYYEDETPIWNKDGQGETFPLRVKMRPMMVMDPEDYIDALVVGPRLEYVKRWAPEDWPLAFFDTLHLLPQKDYRLIEGEMKRLRVKKRTQRRTAGGDVAVEAAEAEPSEEPEEIELEADLEQTDEDAPDPDADDESEGQSYSPNGRSRGPLES